MCSLGKGVITGVVITGVVTVVHWVRSLGKELSLCSLGKGLSLCVHWVRV